MTSWNQLSERDQQILQHVERYRVTTDDILAELFFANSSHATAVQKVASRLAADGWLRKSQPLLRRNVYSLGPAYHQVNAAANTRPFTEQSLPPAIAVLYFCVRNGHKRLSLDELRKIDARLLEGGRTRTLPCIGREHAGRLGIGMLVVDRNSPNRRVIWKLRRLVRQRITRPVYLAWIRSNRMSLTVIVPAEDRVELLAKEIQRKYKSEIPISVVHVPEYAPFVLNATPTRKSEPNDTT